MDCPLLELLTDFKIVPLLAIISSVSIVHECTTQCKYVEGAKQTIEKELLNRQCLGYVHDTSVVFYCLNVYCMNCVC